MSVIIPVFNAERFLAETLGSVAAQTLRDIEVIIIDDGSTDSSPDIATNFCARDRRFRLIRRASNGGISQASNEAIHAARAEWIARNDADDLWLPEKLERQMDALPHLQAASREPIVAIGSSGSHINASGRIVGKCDPGGIGLEEFYRRREAGEVIYMLNPSAVFRKDAFLAAGGYRLEATSAEDVDLWTRMADAGVVVNLADRLVLRRMHGESASDRNFLDQMETTAWVGFNARLRREGLPEIDREAFLVLMGSATYSWDYRRKQRRWKSQWYYRRGGIAMANGRWVAGLFLMCRSLAVTPTLPLGRLARQFTLDAFRRRRPIG